MKAVGLPLRVTSSPFQLDLVDTTGRLQAPALAWLAKHIQAAARALSPQGLVGTVALRIVDDEHMCRLHAQFCDDPTTTDVLTFDHTQPDEGGGVLAKPQEQISADIVVCLDEANRQSQARGGYPVERELLLYAVHGMLHCLGEDDHDDAAFERMHAREDAVLEQIGVGRVFRGVEGGK